MSIGEFDSPSKPATSEYREGWDRAFAAMDGLALQAASSTRLRFSGDSFEFLPRPSYKNGCPILPHE